MINSSPSKLYIGYDTQKAQTLSPIMRRGYNLILFHPNSVTQHLRSPTNRTIPQVYRFRTPYYPIDPEVIAFVRQWSHIRAHRRMVRMRSRVRRIILSHQQIYFLVCYRYLNII
ncbi:hypothetical protein PILCRDRAFT_507203 [Piloderma croceum F 1598]|uniref:Uncharacterized protein n=1 Tax=Piloderma croceum (strain F 1598) TaxID=765440 RepID=A0A0C3FQ30_PILCF|nr:hypothetical protein PILCRDRAFT_507203 [Piloderma croceum F 1598]